MDAKKLPYILERAAQDELIEQGEKLQRGELAASEAEALRTAADPQARVIHELYRPLTDIEQQRLLKAASGKQVPIAAVTSLAVAAVALIVAVARPLDPVPARPIVASQAADLKGNHHMLGDSVPSTERPILDVGGCSTLVVAPQKRGDRLPSNEQVMAFFQRGDTIVPWPNKLKSSADGSHLLSDEFCTRLPDGLSAGDWQLSIIHGPTLPSPEQASKALKGAWIPFWARWNIAHTPVQLRQVGP